MNLWQTATIYIILSPNILHIIIYGSNNLIRAISEPFSFFLLLHSSFDCRSRLLVTAPAFPEVSASSHGGLGRDWQLGSLSDDQRSCHYILQEKEEKTKKTWLRFKPSNLGIASS